MKILKHSDIHLFIGLNVLYFPRNILEDISPSSCRIQRRLFTLTVTINYANIVAHVIGNPVKLAVDMVTVVISDGRAKMTVRLIQLYNNAIVVQQGEK